MLSDRYLERFKSRKRGYDDYSQELHGRGKGFIIQPLSEHKSPSKIQRTLAPMSPNITSDSSDVDVPFYFGSPPLQNTMRPSITGNKMPLFTILPSTRAQKRASKENDTLPDHPSSSAPTLPQPQQQQQLQQKHAASPLKQHHQKQKGQNSASLPSPHQLPSSSDQDRTSAQAPPSPSPQTPSEHSQYLPNQPLPLPSKQQDQQKRDIHNQTIQAIDLEQLNQTEDRHRTVSPPTESQKASSPPQLLSEPGQQKSPPPSKVPFEPKQQKPPSPSEILSALEQQKLPLSPKALPIPGQRQKSPSPSKILPEPEKQKSPSPSKAVSTSEQQKALSASPPQLPTSPPSATGSVPSSSLTKPKSRSPPPASPPKYSTSPVTTTKNKSASPAPSVSHTLDRSPPPPPAAVSTDDDNDIFDFYDDYLDLDQGQENNAPEKHDAIITLPNQIDKNEWAYEDIPSEGRHVLPSSTDKKKSPTPRRSREKDFGTLDHDITAFGDVMDKHEYDVDERGTVLSTSTQSSDLALTWDELDRITEYQEELELQLPHDIRTGLGMQGHLPASKDQVDLGSMMDLCEKMRLEATRFTKNDNNEFMAAEQNLRNVIMKFITGLQGPEYRLWVEKLASNMIEVTQERSYQDEQTREFKKVKLRKEKNLRRIQKAGLALKTEHDKVANDMQAQQVSRNGGKQMKKEIQTYDDFFRQVHDALTDQW